MKYKLSDIFNITDLQKLSESFSTLTGSVTAILDLEGNILTASGWQKVCTEFHRVNPITAEKCRESDTVLASKLKAGEKYNVYKCENGLVDVAVPIVIDGLHIGNLFTGQFFLEPPDEQYFIEQAEACGFDKQQYLAALSKVPIFTEEHIKAVMDYLLNLTHLLGEMGLSKKRALDKSERVFSSYMDSINAYVYIKDIESNYTFINKKTEQLFKITRADLGKRQYTDFDFFDKQMAEQLRQNDKHIIETGEHVEYEEVGYPKSIQEKGCRYYLALKFPLMDDKDNIAGVCGFSYDITQQKLIDNELRMQHQIVTHMEEGVVLIKVSDGTIVYANPKFDDMFGYNVDELSGKHVSVLNAHSDVSPEDKAKQILSSLKETGSWQGDILNVKKDGTKFWCHATVSSFEHTEYGTVWISIHQDITKRVELEKIILKEKKFSETIINTLPGLFYLFDETGKFLLWNKNLETVSGYAKDDIATMNPLDFFTGDDRERINTAIKAAFQSGEVLIDTNFHTKDGQFISYYFTGKIIEIDGKNCLTGLGTDISERVLLEENNRYHAKLFDIIFEHVLESIVLLDKDFNFIRVSKSYADSCRRDISEFIDRNHFEMYPSDFHIEALRVKQQKLPYVVSERPFVFPDHPEWGTTYWDIRLVPVLEKNGEIELFLFTLKDVTEQKKYKDDLSGLNISLEKRIAQEVEKNRLKDRLMYEQSRHMAMGELLVNIAHQWRQPLASIGLLVQDIRDAYVYKELNDEYLDKNINNVMSELSGLSSTIDGFKDFYLSNLQKEEIKIKEIINNALAVTSEYFELKDVVIERELDETLTINVVPSEFAQVVLSILSNTRDVFEQRQPAIGIVKIKSYKETDTNKAVITIADNGGGVPNDIVDKIFDPYFTTKDKSRGVGLGLYITKLIVEKSMKGVITVRNNDGWCEFRIEI